MQFVVVDLSTGVTGKLGSHIIICFQRILMKLDMCTKLGKINRAVWLIFCLNEKSGRRDIGKKIYFCKTLDSLPGPTCFQSRPMGLFSQRRAGN